MKIITSFFTSPIFNSSSCTQLKRRIRTKLSSIVLRVLNSCVDHNNMAFIAFFGINSTSLPMRYFRPSYNRRKLEKMRISIYVISHTVSSSYGMSPEIRSSSCFTKLLGIRADCFGIGNFFPVKAMVIASSSLS